MKRALDTLCQSGAASCGACCGLYNYRRHDRASIAGALERHRRVLRETTPSPEAYRAAAQHLRASEAEPFAAEIDVCPLLGFLDDAQARVGCLGHPDVTGGDDLRDCGLYSSSTCASFECPSFAALDAASAALLRDACPDWYVYGLVVTDLDFLFACVRLVEAIVGRRVDASELRASPLRVAAMRELLALKIDAPGRAEGAIVLGRAASSMEPGALGAARAREDDVVACLGHRPPTRRALDAARAEVRVRADAVVAALAVACGAQ